ncbi:MAG TPA: ribbon-helix-helix protein, CopG family [Candidatus Hydromicrobium sp.]
MEKERTSILLEKDIMLKLKNLAKISNKSTSFIIREAVTEYVTKKVPKKEIGIIGIGNSGGSDIANKKEEYLKGFGED